MNVAYPPSEFKSVEEMVNGLITLVTEGFENPYQRQATVLITIPERPDLDFLVEFDEVLQIIRPADSRAFDTKMTFPLATIERIFRSFEVLDWRSPEIIGTLTLEGDMGLAFLMGMYCMRPSNWTLDRLQSVRVLHAEENHRELTDVIRLHRPSQFELLEAMERSVPAIVTGLEPSPPCKDWTMDTLVEKYGECIVSIRSASEKLTLAQLAIQMEEVGSGSHASTYEKPYTEGAAMPIQMLEDFGPMFFGREDFGPAQLWLGAVSTKIPATALHCDPLTGFLYQVMGRKRLELYSADQANLLYPKKAFNNYQQCWFDPNEPDFERFPDARKAKSISVILHPGELLVQPAGWFHQVYAMDSPTMSVSYFWRY